MSEKSDQNLPIEAPDDPRNEKPLVEHLVELRNRIVKSVIAILVVFLVLSPFMKQLFDGVSMPLMIALPEGTKMLSTGVVAPFLVPLKVTLFLAFVIALPVVLYQIWAYIAPALYRQEKRLVLDGAMETEDCVRALLEALLAGPDEPSLSSPIPEGTALKSLKVSGRRAQIDLSAQYARLTGIDLSLADYCITLTLTQLPNVNAVSITADGRELPYRETQVLLSADTLLSSRESGLRPITVSLYFLDSKTGELRAEQQTLALYEGQTRVNALLEALAQGPEDDSLVSLLPEDFTVISSRIENGVCYLNLPANVSLPEDEAARDLMLSALEQSILSLGGVDEVQFLIEGSAEPDGYR